MSTKPKTKKAGEAIIRRLCEHGDTEQHRIVNPETVTIVWCAGPPRIRLTDSDLAAAFYDVLTSQSPTLHPDLAGPKTRQLIEHLFNPHA